MSDLNIIILAAGMGKRMQSSITKVLHKVDGTSMIKRIVSQAQLLKPTQILVVTSEINNDVIKAELSDFNNIVYVIQYNPQGTGHAVLACSEHLLQNRNDSSVVVLSGDTPLISHTVISDMIKKGVTGVTLMSMGLENPDNYGRIMTDINNKFTKIIEDKDCTLKERLTRRVNCGVYAFNARMLVEHLPKVGNENAQNEYYLPDVIEIIKDSEKIDVELYDLPTELQYQLTNVNDQEKLAYVSEIAHKERMEMNEKLDVPIFSHAYMQNWLQMNNITAKRHLESSITGF